jgi:flagellar basal-body rod protein FlgG
MIYGIYQSAGGMQVNQYRMEVLSNNLANVSTTGFKHDKTVVRERPIERREDLVNPLHSNRLLDDLTGGTLVAPTFTSFEQGPIEQTGRKLDVALSGDGFFTVLDGENVRYTRDGRFTINGDGALVTAAGNQLVLSEEGQPILVNQALLDEVEISTSGDVRAGDVSFGKLGVVGFEDPNQLRKVGSNLLQPVDAQPVDASVDLRPGFLEGSTVEPSNAMVSMIEVNRSYELNATMISLSDGTLGRLVNDVPRLA